MGDTQKSPTISTETQGIAAKVADDSGQGLVGLPADGPPLLAGESSLARIRKLAESEPNLVFRSLAHRIDPGKKYHFEIPFRTKYMGFEPPDELPAPPPQDQINRYPINKEHSEWSGAFGFIPENFLSTLEELQSDFDRIKKEIFG